LSAELAATVVQEAARRSHGKFAAAKLTTLIRAHAWLAVLIIVVLSVVPGTMRPHIMGNDYREHFAAYIITGSLLAIGYPRPTQLLASGVALALCAGGLELVQVWIPGRTASASEFAIGTLSACLGLVAIFVIKRARKMRLPLLYSPDLSCRIGADVASHHEQTGDPVNPGN
jgi:VanZ family protein